MRYVCQPVVSKAKPAAGQSPSEMRFALEPHPAARADRHAIHIGLVHLERRFNLDARAVILRRVEIEFHGAALPLAGAQRERVGRQLAAVLVEDVRVRLEPKVFLERENQRPRAPGVPHTLR